MKYSELTLRYFEGLPLAGTLCGAHVFRAAAGSRERGTWVQFDLRVADGQILEARFLAFACPHTVAVAAWLAERAAGVPLSTLLGTPGEGVTSLARRFEVPTDKLGRLLIVEDALRAAAALAKGRTASHMKDV